MQRRQKSFWGPALLTLGLIVVLKFFHLDARIPFLDQLLANQDPPGIIALLVLGFTLFCLLRLIAWRITTIRTMQIIRLAQQALEASLANQSRSPFRSVDPISQIQGALGQYYENSILKQRLQLAQKRLAEPERALSLMSSQSGIDGSSLQNAYGPTRALIWALPVLGFMGTAIEMAGAVGGLGVALSQTQDYNGLRNMLVNQVVPHLASAFNITVFALGCTVVCFILLSWVHAREQTTLLEADALSLQILADKQFTSVFPISLPAEEQSLIQHLQTLNTTLTQMQRDSGVSSLIPLLQSANNKLETMGESLEQLQNTTAALADIQGTQSRGGSDDEMWLPLSAIARTVLQEDERVIVGKIYVLQAGISRSVPEYFHGEPFDLPVRDVVQSIPFDVSLHASENVELTADWHKHLAYAPQNTEPQLVEFTFQVTAPGYSFLVVDFYRERCWVKTIRLEFDAIEKSSLTEVSSEV